MPDIAKKIADAVAAEREACADICEQMINKWKARIGNDIDIKYVYYGEIAAKQIAGAIIERNDKPLEPIDA